MNAVALFVKRNSFVVFVVLAYLLSWWPALMPGGGLLPHGPMLAALIVVGIGEGKAGLKAWWSRVVHFATSWQWYAVAAAIPAAFALSAAGINLLLGAQLVQQIDWLIPIKVLPIMLLLSGMWEEPGWTAYALPWLYAQNPTSTNSMPATLVTALVRSGWHLPLVFSGSIYWTDLLFVVAFQIFFTWLYNSSGSVPVVMLSHLVSNVFGGELVGSWFAGADWMREAWLRGVLWMLLALVLLLVSGSRLGRKPAAQVGSGSVAQSLAAQ